MKANQKQLCPLQLLKKNPISRLIDFQKDPYGFFDAHRPADTSRPVALRLGHRRFFFCYDPQHAKHVLQDQRHKYDKSGLVLKKIRTISGPTGLIQLKDEEAQKVRQSSTSLTSEAGMNRLLRKIESFVEELYPIIDKSIENQTALDLVPHLTQIVLRTAGVFVLNHDLSSGSEKLNAAFVNLNRQAGDSLRSLVNCPFSRSKSKSVATIQDDLIRLAEKALDDTEPSLFKSLSQNGEARSFIIDQLKSFLFAGYDTTASSLIFATYLVAKHKSTQEKIALEAIEYSGTTYKSLKNSTVVQSAYKEALRLYPSAYFLPRETTCEDEIKGVKIPKGSQVFLSIRHIQRHPDYFQSPDDFIPNRFQKGIRFPFSFIPFGGGPRVCVGASLARLEATMILQMLCRRYEMIPLNESPPEIEAFITAHTKSPLPILFKKRQFNVAINRGSP